MIHPPSMPPCMPKPKPLPTIARRYGVDFCVLCSLMLEYCKCGTTPAADDLAQQAAEAQLRKRIAEVVSKRGTCGR